MALELGAVVAVGVTAALAGSTMLPLRGPYEFFAKGALWRSTGTSPILTFDDGPHPERTPVVLKLLKKHRVSATFFIIGQRALKHPWLVRQIADEGHQVGIHGWDHSPLVACPRSRIARQLLLSYDLLDSVLGTPPSLVRPPYGYRDYRFYQQAARLNLQTWMWSLDSGDWLGISGAAIDSRLSRARAGDIVLMHDGNPRARGLLEALERFLPKLEAIQDQSLRVPCGA